MIALPVQFGVLRIASTFRWQAVAACDSQVKWAAGGCFVSRGMAPTTFVPVVVLLGFFPGRSPSPPIHCELRLFNDASLLAGVTLGRNTGLKPMGETSHPTLACGVRARARRPILKSSPLSRESAE